MLRCCREGCIPAPEHLLKVPARRPGLLLVFRNAVDAEAALAAIRAGRPRIMGPPAPGPPGARPGLPPGLGPQSATAGAHSGSPPPRGRPIGGDGRERGGRGERERERGEADGRDGGGEGAGGPLPPAEYANRTLWVGQVRRGVAGRWRALHCLAPWKRCLCMALQPDCVPQPVCPSPGLPLRPRPGAPQIPPGVREDVLVDLFRSCGELAGHKFLRHTACMFVDFASLAGAIEVRSRPAHPVARPALTTRLHGLRTAALNAVPRLREY